jgi:hypothetical protein
VYLCFHAQPYYTRLHEAVVAALTAGVGPRLAAGAAAPGAKGHRRRR